MSFDRVRFFQRSDWGYGVGMEKIEILEIPDYNGKTINDAIEYYQIKRYFDDGARVKSWTEAQYQEYKEKSKKLYGLCMRFFNAPMIRLLLSSMKRWIRYTDRFFGNSLNPVSFIILYQIVSLSN